MRGDRIIATQLMMAQGFNSLADMISNSTGYAMVPVTYLELPAQPAAGMICCIDDSGTATWGEIVTPGGFHTVLVWYNGTQWLVLGGVAPEKLAPPSVPSLPSLPSAIAGQINVANPVSTTSTSYVMMGMGLNFTFHQSRVVAIVDGQITNSLNNGETDAQLMYGFGVAPDYGDPPPSDATVLGGQIRFKATAGGGAFTPFSQSGLITGLFPNQQVWVGLALKVVAGSGSVQDISLLMFELL